MQKQKKRQRLDGKQQRRLKELREGGLGGLQSGPRGRGLRSRSPALSPGHRRPGPCPRPRAYNPGCAPKPALLRRLLPPLVTR